MLRAIAAILAAWALAAPAAAQDDPQVLVIEMRVSASVPGASVVVDRGESDGLALGDLVTFRTREGVAHRGVVIHLDERSAMVELHEDGVTLEPGTRGEARVPADRLAAPAPPPPVDEPDVEHPPWENTDEEFSEGMPLLAEVEAVRPEDRARRLVGRAYTSGNITVTSEDGRSDSYLGAGTDFELENPLGRGGVIHVDAELYNRDVQVPDRADDATGRARVNRASYAWGGTRFSEKRWELGRFLQHGMPEFGVLDGFEWSNRLENGHRYGASVGYMPAPTEDFESFQDFQLAAYYLWTSDESERFTVGGGLQKSWNNGDNDRDLVVLKAHYLPLDGWDFNAATWIDFYGNDELVKDAGPELTQTRASFGRRWGAGDGLELSFSETRFPEVLRDEYLALNLIPLLNAHNQRLALRNWHRIGDHRLHGQLGVWDDESDSGGDVELGLDLEGVLFEDGHVDLTLFYVTGQFSYVPGARLSFGSLAGRGTWDAFYEIADHHQAGFPDDFDDIIQHRVGTSYNIHTDTGWNLNARLASSMYDTEGSLTASLFLQRSF